jgi:class 3 adenylate cyclase
VEQTRACPECAALNAIGARYCDQCGVFLGSAEPLPAGDRRIVTALFADLVDYVGLVATHDAEEVRRQVDDAFRVMGDAVVRYGGTLEKFIGDAVFAIFGVPIAHDDDALRAALAAIDLRSGLRERALAQGHEALEIRIGIATGEVVAGPREVHGYRSWSATGEVVTRAARLQQAAVPDEILVDASSRDALGRRATVGPIETRRLPGRPQPIHGQRLLEARPAGPGGRPAHGLLVGRHREQERLRAILRSTVATGRGRVVVVVGEAGIGKTRLIAELESEARALAMAWTWTENHSYLVGEPYGLARRHPERIADDLGFDPGTLVRDLLATGGIPADRIARYAGVIAAVAREAAFTGWEAEQALVPVDQGEFLAAFREITTFLTVQLAARGPRVSVIDDLHWADASSAPMLDALVRSVANLPAVVLLATRPGALPDWAALTHVEVIELAGLDALETGELAGTVAGGAVDPLEARRIHERTEGNPLFVVETVRALHDEGSLVFRDGRYHLAEGARIDVVPIGLRAVLGARIDGLPAGWREVLGIASVVGVSFDVPTIEALIERPIEPVLIEQLAETALIVPDGRPDAWRFRHPLIHDVAYAGLLGTRRRALHARLADHMEATAPATTIGQLAVQRAASGDAARAIPLLVRAADVAAGAGAIVEAAGYLRRAAELSEGPAAEVYATLAREVLAGGECGRDDPGMAPGQ